MSKAVAASQTAAIEAQAVLHHQYLLGLELMVASNEGPDVVGEWMFRLFRQQHEEKFLSSFAKLGLLGLPDAVACAKYHVLANGVGGVPVEYMYESDQKAWVRFRYPRWMFDGPVLCGVPVAASRGFLRGWYAQNGVSLGNPRLGFVCVSEDMTAQFGLCGYFKEYSHELAEDERLVFAPDECPPEYQASQQPQLADTQWSAERLAKARRNYAVEYVRNGVRQLHAVLGRQRSMQLAMRAARLTGLQHYSVMASATGAVDGGLADAGNFLSGMFAGMGDTCTMTFADDNLLVLKHQGLRIVRGIDGTERADLLACWIALWEGAIASQRAFMEVQAIIADAPTDDPADVPTDTPTGHRIEWRIRLRS